MAQNIRKMIDEFNGAQQKIDKGIMRARLTCDHQFSPRENALKQCENKNDPSKRCYKCEKCGALIPTAVPTEDQINEAVKTLETASHFLRLMSDPSSEKGKEKCEWLAGTMMDVIKMGKAYIQLKKDQEGRSKKNKQKKSGSHSMARVEI